MAHSSGRVTPEQSFFEAEAVSRLSDEDGTFSSGEESSTPSTSPEASPSLARASRAQKGKQRFNPNVVRKVLWGCPETTRIEGQHPSMQFHCPRSQEVKYQDDAIRRLIQTSLTPKDSNGSLFIGRREELLGYLWIGATNSPRQRITSLQRECQQVFYSENPDHNEVFGYKRYAKLVQYSLSQFWQSERPCPRCRKYHESWFQISNEVALEKAGMWKKFMLLKPYEEMKAKDEGGHLKKEWIEHLKNLDGTVNEEENENYNWEQWIWSFGKNEEDIAKKYPKSKAGVEYYARRQEREEYEQAEPSRAAEHNEGGSSPSIGSQQQQLPSQVQYSVPSASEFTFVRRRHQSAPALPSTTANPPQVALNRPVVTGIVSEDGLQNALRRSFAVDRDGDTNMEDEGGIVQVRPVDSNDNTQQMDLTNDQKLDKIIAVVFVIIILFISELGWRSSGIGFIAYSSLFLSAQYVPQALSVPVQFVGSQLWRLVY